MYNNVSGVVILIKAISIVIAISVLIKIIHNILIRMKNCLKDLIFFSHAHLICFIISYYDKFKTNKL